MKPAPIPANDAERLDALRRLLILDTPPEERFDRIVNFAAEEFDMPMAQLSLVDEHRQWFKARVGMSLCQTARAESFCGHVVELTEGLVVEDATLDERFFDNPLVTGEPYVRFYAGAPLVLPCGNIVGALCVLDRRPRTFDAMDRAILHSLRDLAMTELLSSECNAA
ncbi:MAG: putative sensor protein [Rhizobacter sp.]|jgi:GAF domain-containing protein|nr:putative sensor protein [Rhizobacter sp.]